ncbi:hypothetical protein [Gulosibacter sp. ACHW.36C]|uniref:Lipoprotein n=1 Tax=Gulosibacter sediminis TaxID=1729695 RepID=A0ABY4N0Q8_9MICO|nr:hypothetical protein [Gulosibacter sediminis]UQN15535.1 hypothetical protein M3M28_03485 [Gulosibacter sediminis]
MRTPGSPRGVRHAAALLAAASMLALTGCAGGGDAAPTGTAAQETSAAAPTPTATELTEAEALDIAVATYEEYLAAEREVIASGGDKTDAFESLTTENMQDYFDQLVQLAASDNFTVEGDLSVANAEVQQYKDDEITVYVCIDLADSQVYDGTGVEYGEERSGVIQPAEVRVVNLTDTPQIDAQKLWPELDLCQ